MTSANGGIINEILIMTTAGLYRPSFWQETLPDTSPHVTLFPALTEPATSPHSTLLPAERLPPASPQLISLPAARAPPTSPQLTSPDAVTLPDMSPHSTRKAERRLLSRSSAEISFPFSSGIATRDRPRKRTARYTPSSSHGTSSIRPSENFLSSTVASSSSWSEEERVKSIVEATKSDKSCGAAPPITLRTHSDIDFLPLL